MKKVILFTALFAGLLAAPTVTVRAQVQTTNSFAGYLTGTQGAIGATVAMDTLIDVDTTIYVSTILGKKSDITWQINTLKISGTQAGTIRLEGSTDGVNYETALAATAVTIADGSANYTIKLTVNSYQKYRLKVISSGTNHQSNRVYLLYRE